MKLGSCLKWLVCLAGFLSAGSVQSQSVDTPYAVGTWQGFRSAAVTHTFDDNDENQLRVAVPLFNELGFRLTLFVATNIEWNPVEWNGLVAAAQDGHEIASHTVTHAKLNELSDAQQRDELAVSQAVIRENVPGQPVLTLAYPYCLRGNDAITREYYLAARACQGEIERSSPRDIMNVSAISVGARSSVYDFADLNVIAKEAAYAGGWAVFVYHGIDDDGGYSPTSSEELRRHLEYLSANEAQFWVDTFGNVVRYIRERNAAIVEEIFADDRKLVVNVSDTLENTKYDVPISIRRNLPVGWESAIVIQSESEIPSRIHDEDGERFITFDAVPDAGMVTILRRESTELASERDAQRRLVAELYPNPSTTRVTISYVLTNPGRVSIDVFDVLGRQVQRPAETVMPAGSHALVIDVSDYYPGAYVYRVRSGSASETGLFVVDR